MFPRAVWLLFIGTLINRFGGFVLVFLILYLTRGGYSAAQAGLAVGAYGVGAIAASLIGGFLADRIGRRGTIALSMLSAAVAILALERARSFGAIVALVALTGLTAEAYRPAASAMLGDLVEPARRVTAFAWYRLSINLGAALGPLLGGWLAQHSFRWLFWGDALSCAIYGVLALALLPETRPVVRPPAFEAESSIAIRAEPSGGRTWLRDPWMMRFLIASTLTSIVYAQMHSTFALQVTARGLSDATYGVLIGLNGLVVLALELPIASITQRLPKPPVIAFAFVMLGIGFGLTGVAATAWLLAGTVVIWTLGEIVGAPVASAYVTELAPPAQRGRYQGAWSMTFAIGYVLGPALGASLFGWRPATLWTACFGACVVAAMLVATSPKRAQPGP
ncbi:MAG TPA: MFS transporter [Candidatus Eisenbacteria bacterium]|nr:MFS transporter [Candidatus Eisenbacteria bacterium]